MLPLSKLHDKYTRPPLLSLLSFSPLYKASHLHGSTSVAISFSHLLPSPTNTTSTAGTQIEQVTSKSSKSLMGLCLSSGGAAEGLVACTAMVLLPTGELREYPRSATAARVLEDSVGGEAGWFLCDADAMGFEGPVAAVGGAEELHQGQIYFVLPAEVRRHGLRREEVAALAVKASAALVKTAGANSTASGGGRRRRGAVAPLLFAQPEKEEEAVVYKATPAPAGKRRPVARGGGKGGMRRQQPRFAPDLSAIPEGDMSE